MKKILLLFMGVLLLTGCGKINKEEDINKIISKINNVKSYKVTGNMEISNDEETFTYSIESYYLKDNYYKVLLVNQTNNHEQIILRNNGDIYVITPSLNKSFKFQSSWPNNSSQSYMLKSIVKDIENDKNHTIEKKDNGYIVKTLVNYPNNNELKYQKIYINKDNEFEKVEVYDENDIVKIKVEFSKIELNPGLKEEDFRLEDYINNNDDADDNKNVECENNEECTKEKKTVSIENIIYPLYIPSNTYLTSSERIDNGDASRVILTFSGDKKFVLIEEASLRNSNMEIIPVYGEPLMLSESVGALSANSLSWDNGNISYYLASTDLNINEMSLIANSLGNNVLVANTK